MRRLIRFLSEHRDAAVFVTCLLAALVATQITDDWAEERPQIAEARP